MTEFIGKAVSIHCKKGIGIFQGHIKSANESKITIIRAFRNGVPLKKPDMEITINAADIEKLDLIPTQAVNSINKPMPIKQASQNNGGGDKNGLTNGFAMMKIGSYPNSRNGFTSSPKLASKSPATIKMNGLCEKRSNGYESNGGGGGGGSRSKAIEIPNSTTPMRNERKKSKRYNRNSAFGTPIDDPNMEEDFDFEKNLALFDKQAIWDEIENGSITEKPDLLRQAGTQGVQKKYRHDENVLNSKPPQYRQIETEYKNVEEYVTDDGLVIPALPFKLRDRVQNLAAVHGLTWERQSDMLARGGTELAMLLLGGARRLTPKNQHQWPTISIICDEPFNEKSSEVGIITGRHLASHGLKVMLFVRMTTISERPSKELELFTDTGNDFTYSVNDLPQSDLVILTVKNSQLSQAVSEWILSNRAPVLAIDPPPEGVKGVKIKCSLLPILPLNGLNSNACGKLYLCNLGIPLKFFRDSGIKYKSPFGSKFVIPLHEASSVAKNN